MICGIGISQSEPMESQLSDVNELEISLETAIRERDAARDVMKSQLAEAAAKIAVRCVLNMFCSCVCTY